MNSIFPFQVLDPLRAMIAGPPLEDARHLAQRYSRMRQEAEVQVIKSLGICALVHAIIVIRSALNLTCLLFLMLAS